MDEYIVFGLMILAFQDFSHGGQENYVFVHEHETVTLTCSSNFTVWWGPINLTTYVSGGKLDPNLPNYRRLTLRHNQTTNSTELQIREFAKEDQGLFRCSYFENNRYQFKEETVSIKKDPKNLTIQGTTNDIIYFKSSHSINLTCYVESGIPKETIIWISNGIELSRGGPSSLTYTFTPGHDDHQRNFSCIVLTDSISLEKSVELFLYFPPSVLIVPANSVRILEGASVDLRCDYSSNHKIKAILWKYKNTNILNSSELHYRSIKREQTGDYSCTVVNQAGNATANVTIEVFYQPDVAVSFLKENVTRKLKCNPDGFPDRYLFSDWEHISEFREHIRFLPSTETGILSIPFVQNETDRHFDKGIYICTVTNNVSVDGSTFVSGEYWLNSTGKPYFVSSNNATQYGILNKKSVITADIVENGNINDITLLYHTRKVYEYSPSAVTTKDTIYGKTVLIRGTRLSFFITALTTNDFRRYTIFVNNTIGSSHYAIRLRSPRPLRSPQNIKAVPLETTIIIKWTADLQTGLQEHFFVEYRKHFETSWSKVSAENRSSAKIIDLEPNTVYLLRVYSKTEAGESNRTDDIIVKTEKRFPKSYGFTVEFALILGMVHVMIFLCWFGVKAFKNRQLCNRIRERETVSLRNDGASVRPVHYDEIDSMYYNPANLMIVPQIIRNNAQGQTSTDNTNLDNHETSYSTSQNIRPCSIQGNKSSNENNSLRSSSDESYLVPCRHYIDFDIQKVSDNEHQVKRTSEQDITGDESSFSSDNSETNTKSIQRYETLKVSEVNEHCYKKYNDINV